MKNIFIVIFIAIAAGMSGQSVDQFSQDSVLYLTAEQEAFMIDKETKYLFKTGPLGFERKISQAFSINAAFSPTYSGSGGLQVTTGAEVRYYYKLSKLIKEGRQANNLSSEYFSAGLDYDGSLFGNSGVRVNSYDYNISWGSQRRFLNYGYIDYGMKLGYESYSYDLTNFGGTSYSAKLIRLSTKTAVGFAFGQRYKIRDMVKCPIFKCHLDRKSSFKLDYNKIFNLAYGTNSVINNRYQFFANINPNISYEHKVGTSPFSINQELDFLLAFSSRISNSNPNAGISSYSMAYTVSLRHYFRLKSEIRKGKTGNNLSGVYWFGGASFNYGDSKLPLFDINSDVTVGKHNYINIPVGLGYQKSLLNDLYYDFQLGFELRANENIRPNISSIHQAGLFIEFKVGKLF
ncbi:MAG: hypothetical protein ACJA1A_000772 [Saprospiraceae bacterium]|jgi:hypothetical protein|tara:strand:- start:1 stop:1212 length:1212 start_codon:yes stop_codon:yes gene_type:complete